MLEIRDLHVKFHNRDREAVAGVSLTIHDGEILGLVGESGSGKSVTAMSVAGLLPRRRCDYKGQVLLPALTIGFNNAVLAEASMSFLCIGVTPPDASLGYMLSEAQGMLNAPWYVIGTGLMIVLMVFGVGLIGEGLQRRDKGVA